MSFDYTSLVTDRGQADVDALKALVKKPLNQWTAAEAEAFNAAALRGAYNYTDLNRVNACMEDLVARLNGLGYAVPGYERAKIQRAEENAALDPYVWDESDAPTESQMAAYLGNVAAVRQALSQAAGTPSTPESMANLTTSAANDIEKILADTDRLVMNIPKAWYFSGEVCAGEI